MAPFTEINPKTANPTLRQQFQLVESIFGGIPNLMKMFANAPDGMEAFTLFYKSLTTGSLTNKELEQIAIAVSASNGCEYCIAVHFFIGAHLGINRDELVRNLTAASLDQRTATILQFAKELVENKGPISESSQRKLIEHNINQSLQIEILCIVYAFSLLNRLKHLTQPNLDFPIVKEYTSSFK